jgi:uncharacterized protein (DUF1330 family)
MGRKERTFGPLPPVTLEDLVPVDHCSHHLERTLDLAFVRDLGRDASAAVRSAPARPALHPDTGGPHPMPAYILTFPQDLSGYAADDPTELEPYADRIEQTMAAYGGRYLRLRKHPMEVLEGDWQPPLGMGISEFPSMEQARAWYHSPEYAPLLAWRKTRGRFNLLLVDGMPEGMTSRSTALAEVEQARAERRRERE